MPANLNGAALQNANVMGKIIYICSSFYCFLFSESQNAGGRSRWKLSPAI
jgi:hypothetical protein